nr:protein 71 [synthetic construct]
MKAFKVGSFLFGLVAILSLFYSTIAAGDSSGNYTGYEKYYAEIDVSFGGGKVPQYFEKVQIKFFDKGNEAEIIAATVFQWLCLVASVGLFGWYTYQLFNGSCGWEVVYVSIVETCKYLLEIFAEPRPPATIYASHGSTYIWLRYAEWLMTCPVLLIHLSNITGLKEEYSHYTMRLLTSGQGPISMGITSAAATGGVKIFFFCLGLCYGGFTFYSAAQVYMEAYHMVPRGQCRGIVRMMAWCYFASWPLFPILFLFGPEGFNIISLSGSHIGHAVADLLSKNLWGWFGWYLRYKIREYVIEKGDIRRVKEIEVLGRKFEVEEYMDEEELAELP